MRRAVLALATLAVLAPVHGQAQASSSVEPVREGLHAVFRSGGNVAVLEASDGAILIDDGYPDGFAEIQELIGQVSDLPIAFVLSAKTTVAPERVREYGPRQPEFQTAVHIAGLDVRAIYVGQGPDGEDVVVYLFPDQRSVYVGLLLDPTVLATKHANEAISAAWIRSVDTLVTLDFEVVIPTYGAVMDRSDVVRFRDVMVAVRSHTTELVGSDLSEAGVFPRARTPVLSRMTQ